MRRARASGGPDDGCRYSFISFTNNKPRRRDSGRSPTPHSPSPSFLPKRYSTPPSPCMRPLMRVPMCWSSTGCHGARLNPSPSSIRTGSSGIGTSTMRFLRPGDRSAASRGDRRCSGHAAPALNQSPLTSEPKAIVHRRMRKSLPENLSRSQW